jgi:hypothetical protein
VERGWSMEKESGWLASGDRSESEIEGCKELSDFLYFRIDILYGLKWKEILEMEMEMNWSKPKVLLSLRDTQGSPDVSAK